MKGLVTSVLATAAGTLARMATAAAALSGIWAIGINSPKNTPMAMPSARPRRPMCHSRGWNSAGPSQRSQRLPRSLSCEGIRSLSLRMSR